MQIQARFTMYDGITGRLKSQLLVCSRVNRCNTLYTAARDMPAGPDLVGFTLDLSLHRLS